MLKETVALEIPKLSEVSYLFLFQYSITYSFSLIRSYFLIQKQVSKD